MLDQTAASHVVIVTWTEERVELLRKMFAGGLSHRQMGIELGVTRNAAIGKCSRLGLVRGPIFTFPQTAKPLSRQGDGGIVEKVRFGQRAREALADKDRATTQRI